MGQLAFKDRIQSDIIAYETGVDYGVCRSELVFDNSSDELLLGSVLMSTTYGRDWALAVGTDFDDDTKVNTLIDEGGKNRFAVVIDPKAGVGTLGTSATTDVLCIVRGTCGVKKHFLVWTVGFSTTSLDNLEILFDALMPLVRIEESSAYFNDFTDQGT